MRLTTKLLLAHWRRHWLRTLLAVAALVTSVAMVIVVVGGYDVAMARATAAAGRAAKALGDYDLVAISGSPQQAQARRWRMGAAAPDPALGQDLLAWLAAQPGVKARLDCCQAQVEARSLGAMFQYAMYRPGELMTCPLYAMPTGKTPYPLAEGAWPGGDADEVVVDRTVARMARCGLGEPFQLAATTGRHQVKVAGILDTPGGLRGLAGIYVTPALFERLTGQGVRVNRIWIDLADDQDVESFTERLVAQGDRLRSPVRVETPADYQAEAMRWASMPARSAMGFFPLLRDVEMNLAILTAMFIVFATFSMGLRERSRQLAMLRAIGMTRRQMMGLVMAEAMVLATVGWAGGLIAGQVLMDRSLAAMPGLGQQDLSLHAGLWAGMGAIVAYGATFLAAALPTLLAVRKRPLDVMSGAPLTRASRAPRWLPVIALPLILANPVIVHTSLVTDRTALRTVLPLGLLAAIVGFAMLLPALVAMCQGLFARAAALVFRLDHRLLSKQLAANVWRTVGCTSALMVALGLFVTIQIWGQSMMVPFLVSSRSPDAVATVFPDGVPADKLDAVAALDGVRSALPMVLQHPALAGHDDDGQAGVFASRDLIYIGCDVRKLVDPENGMIGASFLRGSAEEAFKRLEGGDACLITDSLYLRWPERYDVGKPLVLDSVDEPRRSLTYTIAGVIDLPGWHLLTKSAQMRRGLGRVGGIVMVPTATARAAYGQAPYKTFWFALNEQADPAVLERSLIKIVDPDAKPMRPTSRPASRPGMGGRRGGPGGGRRGGPGGGPGGLAGGRGGGPGGGPPGGMAGTAGALPPLDSSVYCRFTDTRAMTQAIRQRSEGIIQAMTVYPLLALGLASLAVVSTVTVSVRVRSWEFGILRSLGLTRGQLLRQVLAEGFLIALLACVTSLLFGLLASWVGIVASSRAMAVLAPLVIPWPHVLLGLAAAVTLCLLASVWPALTVALSQPLRLLQEGRSSQ